MAGRIPQSFIDDLLERTDLVDIIDSRVPLKKAGRNYTALCPFHKEKSPSFSVNPDKQFYYCFGCGAGGNAVSFLMDYERLDFPAAIETLAHIAGVEIPREEQSPSQTQHQHKQRDLHDILEGCARFYEQQLRQHPRASQAVNYLKGRGLTGVIAKQFGLGYAPPGRDNLLNSLPHNEAEKQLLIEAGMVIEKEDKVRYDRFRERVMFPIRDGRGRIIGFGGRVLGDEKPKYLNSPETPIFHKSQELYGLYEARRFNRHLERVLVVEGYMDVIALAQFGITYAVATLGTATSNTHVEKLFRQCNEIVFCFDGDKAGRAAADKALDVTLPLMNDGRQARFLFLPEGDDPDSLVRREGTEGFEQRLRQATPLSDYLLEQCARDLDLTAMDSRARFAKLALAKIQQLPEGLFRQLMIEELSGRTGLHRDSLLQDGPRSDGDSNKSAPDGEPRKTIRHDPVRRQQLSPEARKLRHTPTRQAITILLNYPELAPQVDLKQLKPVLSDSEGRLLADLIQAAASQEGATPYSLLGHWIGKPEFELVTALLAANASKDIDIARLELQDCLSRLGEITDKHQHKNLIEQLSQRKNITLADLSPSEQAAFLRIFKNRKNDQ